MYRKDKFLEFESKMESVDGKSISASFMSLQLQLKTLLEEAGGESALELLDQLSQLTGKEQEVVLSLLSKVVKRIADGEERLYSTRDKILQDFEENLYRDLADALRTASYKAKQPRLAVVDGGKSKKAANAPLDLAAARKARRPFLN